MERAHCIGVLATAVVAFGVAGFAQDSPPQQPQVAVEEAERAQAEESEGRVFKDQIVVTASRDEQASSTAPAPITVIDRLEIEQQQPEKMADLFKAIPGVEIQGEGPFRGIPVIRGLSSNRILILVDGQRLNNARESTDFAGIQPALVNLSEVERIEVLRGPASVQYGSDAIGGVVNIITRRPDLGGDRLEIDGSVAFEYGSTSDSQGYRAAVTGAGKGFSFHVGGSYEDVGDYRAADGAAEDERYQSYVFADDTVPNSGMEQTDFDSSFRILTGEQGVLRINAEVVRTKDVGFPGFDPATSGIDISFPNFDRDKLGIGWESGPVWGLDDISLSAWYQKIDKESIRNFGFGTFFSDQFTRSEVDSFGFNVQSAASLGINNLIFGLDLYQDELHDEALSESSFSPPSDAVAVPDSRQRGIGLYVQDRIALSSRLSLDAGLRGDSFSFVSDEDPRYPGEPFDVTDSALSGNLGVVYALTGHVNLTGLVARGFRSPNLQERSFSGLASTGDTYVLQNPDLDAEQSWNYELGFKVRYPKHSGGASVFYNDLTDFITLEFLDPSESPIPGLEAARLANVDQARIWGAELDLETMLGNFWTAFGTAAYIEGDNETTGEPLSSIPPFKLVLGLRYQRESWWTEGSLRFLDGQDRLPTDDPRYETGRPGFTVYDLRGGYDFDFGLGVLLALENLSDKLYSEPYNNRPEPGRNLRATLRYRF